MITAIGNSGSRRSPKPKSVMMHKGIKGLVASGPGMTKTVDHAKVRPEKNEGAMIKHDAMKSKPTLTPSKTAMPTVKGGSVKVSSHIRPEGAIKRDAAKVIKA